MHYPARYVRREGFVLLDFVVKLSSKLFVVKRFLFVLVLFKNLGFLTCKECLELEFSLFLCCIYLFKNMSYNRGYKCNFNVCLQS